MIIGIGVDMTDMPRFMRVLLRPFAKRFIARVLHPFEQKEFYAIEPVAKLQARFLAKRFAAKEAFGKAMGTGIRWPVAWHSMYVGHNKQGRPEFIYESDLKIWMDARHSLAHLSLSDEQEKVIAFVVIEQRGECIA